MAHVSGQDLGTLFDHLADVIEGGNDHNAGTVMQGIPGRYSNDPKLMDGTESSVTASAAGSTTAVPVNISYWSQSRWNKPDSPRYSLLCTSAVNLANLNKARRINDWVTSTRQFTTEAFPAAVSETDTFTVLQGFRMFPDDQDFEDEETQGSHDRFFVLELTEGVDRGIRGRGVATRESLLIIRLRILHGHRMVRARKSAFANAALIREGVMNNINRSAQLACVLAGGDTLFSDVNDHNLVIAINIPIIYRMNTSL